MDEAERDRLIAEVAAQQHELLVLARYERDERHAAGRDTAWLDELITGLEQAEDQIDDLATLRAVRAAVERHGPGPWPADELATIAGVDVDDVRRVVARMVAEGLAEPPDAPPGRTTGSETRDQ